ncbi:hypothetical protein [Kitasatospora sp. MMS16-BH015]|uniref:hypothetical protein n=1 Tax=Kitasatospora sp. MMS16-BH015 TaxID=2018025 RepID=UPI00131A4F5E|nr:hypothetical protein [Kitasatospora sp. MMS16-BH015]
MTTPGTNGAPEGAADEDPFAYLYRPQAGEEAAEQPRGAISRPMEVGRAQYGQQSAYGQPYGQQYPPQQPPYGQQPPPYGQQQPTVPAQPNRYAEHSRPQPGEDRPSGGRGKAAVIGAVAVVAAIAIGAGIALSGGGGGKTTNDAGGKHTAAPASPAPSSATASPSATPTASSAPIADASKLQGQGTSSASAIKGAISADGSYLTLQPGASITWTVSVAAAGQYKFWLHYNNSGADVPAAVSVNGKDRDGGVTLKNWAKSSDPTQSWVSTNIWPELQAGTNTLTVSIPAGGSGSVPVDQVAITPMSASSYPR